MKVVGPNPDASPEAPPATDVRLNAKGDLALVLLNDELWMIPIRRVGGTPTVDLGKPGVATEEADVDWRGLLRMGAANARRFTGR